jgi:hypothetical protein
MTQYVRPGDTTTTSADVVVISSPQPSEIIQQKLVITGTSGTGGGASSYVHTQSTAATVWTVTHALGYYPSVRIQDPSFNDLEADVRYTNANVLTITFSTALTGVAYLS